MKETGVIIARFQTPILHQGHIRLLNEISGRHNRLVVVLGVAPVKSSRRNPFDFHTRERMIKALYPQLVVLPLKDHSSDRSWSLQLDELLTSTFPNESFRLYGSRDSFIPSYSGKLPVEELPSEGEFSSTNLRDEYSDKVLGSSDFRAGINYAFHNSYIKVYPTVDIALLDASGKSLLLGRKPGSTHWRLPGGFVDPSDASMEAAAKRELTEECGAIETDEFRYVTSAKIDDWRYRLESDKIITMLFVTRVVYGTVKASDDLEEVRWFTLEQLRNSLHEIPVSPEHEQLIQTLLDNLNF